jgi:PPIC-type PPIASE domain
MTDAFKTLRRRAAGLLILAASCNHETASAPAVAVNAPLAEGVAADVGGERVSTALVAEIAQRQGVTLVTARDRAISDALFAAYARERYRGQGMVESAERSGAARELLVELGRDAERKGPPTDDEIARLTQERWQELDHPVLSRTTHAVVVFDDPRDDAKAKRVAERVQQSVAGISDPKQFRERAKAVDAEGLDLRTEELFPVAPDGRVADPNQPPGSEPNHYDVAFAKAAAAIPEVGGESSVVRSSFGYHVILLTERIPERHVPLKQRREWLEREILDRRAKTALDALEQELARKTPVEVDRAAADLMAKVQIQR